MSEIGTWIIGTARGIQEAAPKLPRPPEDGSDAATDQVVPFSVVRNTRGYIERIVHQANGCFERGWFDACAVMLRRLIETLIIEAFEHCGISSKIKNPAGDFYFLGDLIDKTLSENSWNLGRTVRRALPKLKTIGDQSAHSRRFIAHRGDIERIVPDLRVVVQEFVFLADLK